MKLHIYPLLICLLIPFLSTAQIDTTIAWANIMGGTHDTHNSDIKPTGDGGYIVAGSTSANDVDVSGNHGGTDAWVVKLDAAGNIVWQKCLGGSANDAARSIQQTSDGGYIVAGTTNSNDGDVSGNHSTNGNADVWIVKLTAKGTVQWQKCLGGSNNDFAHCIQLTPDGGYIFTAGTNSTDGDVGPNHTDTSYWCVKLNSTGAIQWQKTFNGAAFANTGLSYSEESVPTTQSEPYFYYWGSSIQNTADKGFIISAESDHTVADNHGGVDYLVLKLDSTGNIQWQKSFGDSLDNFATCIKSVGVTGGYIVLGSTTVTNHPAPLATYLQVPWILRLSSSGDIEWQKKDSLKLEASGHTPDNLFIYANSVSVQPNGNYFICGYATGHAGLGGVFLGWLAKLDSTGVVKGTTTYPDKLFYDFSPTSDGGFVAAGDTYNYLYKYTGYQDTFVARTYVVKFKESVLPILLINLTATPQKSTLLTQWQTATEENSSYFNVQRSTDAVHFITVGKVAAAGNSATQQSYTYTDNVAALLNTYTTFYYRLQEVDKNGDETISKVVKVIFPSQNIAISASPNPVKDVLTVRINNYGGNATLNIFDMVGRKLQQVTQYTNNANTITINTAPLAAGTYIISTVVNGVKLEQKFVKQ